MPVSKNTRKGKLRTKAKGTGPNIKVGARGESSSTHTIQDSVKQLNVLHAQCLNAIGHAASLGKLVTSEHIQTYSQRDELTQAYVLLSKDLNQMTDTISAFTPQHRMINELAQGDDSDSPDHLFTILDLCGGYQEWIQKFESVVRPTIKDIEHHLESAKQEATTSE